MQTVQMTLDEELVSQVDQVTKELKMTRSAFTRQALSDALERYCNRKLEEQHRKGYETHPPKGDEFSIWENEQVWGE